MKQRKIIDAYKALNNLYKEKLPIKESYEIYRLRSQLQDVYLFELEREKKMMEETGATFDAEDNLLFKKKEDLERFRAATEEANEMEIDLNITALHMEIARLGDIFISPEDIERLDGFISFG